MAAQVLSPEFWTTINLSPAWWEPVLGLAAAALCGMLIGWEREAREKPAGIKTHGMVALGSAGFTVIGVALLGSLTPLEHLNPDPMRLISGIAGGIGFLGAGAIIQSGDKVRGLTTAATLWVAAAVGVGCGLNYYAAVVALVVLALFLLTFIRLIEDRLVRDQSHEKPSDDR